MFRINITRTVLDKIRIDVRRPYERIGLLIGAMHDDGLWVTDVIPGGDSSDRHSCQFNPYILARAADDIVQGKIDGRIVGWYHSHIGHGVFMSDVDLETQSTLQQFSPYVIAMVVDSETSEFGIWAYDLGHGLMQVSNEDLRIF